MKWFLILFATGLLVSCEAARLRRQFFPDDFNQGSTVGDQFGNQFFSDSRYPQFNRPNQGFNNNGFNNNGFQQQPNQNQGFNGFQQQPNQNQGFNNNQNQNNRPQPNQGNNQNFNTQPPTQAPAAVTQPPTTLAPAVQSCVDTCGGRTTAEYNPVCGSDNMTYHNPARLTCAQDCGASITRTRVGACRNSK